MKQRVSLPEVLQELSAQGYYLADSGACETPNESIRSVDWRLDSVQKVSHTLQHDASALVIAVSSVSKRMKLVFVEAPMSKADFSPMSLLRRLFPMRGKN
jgi:hypothetical protein